MKIHYSLQSIPQLAGDLGVFFCFEGDFLKDAALQAIDQALGGWLKQTIKTDQFTGKKNQSLLLPTYGKTGMNRILLLGMGPLDQILPTEFRNAAVRVVRIGNAISAEKITWIVPKEKQWVNSSEIQFFIEGILLGNYRFDKYLTGDKKRPSPLKDIHFSFLQHDHKALPKDLLDNQIQKAKIIADSVNQARDWVNEPAEIMTPHKMGQTAHEIVKKNAHLKLKILSTADCEKLGMGLFLAVAKGSDLAPEFIHLSYHPPKLASKSGKRIALIGKGITFDSGGLAIKTPQGMMDMKADMGGGAAVLATMNAIAQLGSPHEVHAFIACAENMISGRAYRLRDILISMSGKTVEITNTDAEGRLTLADSITYALKQVTPHEILDIATLTGACVVALGPHMAGVMGNDPKFIERFLAASRQVGEEMWPLPIPEFTQDMLKSDVADLKNAGDRNGGALTAARFLKEFVGDVPWIHVDIAGPAFLEKEWGHLNKGGTGFGVATCIEYLTAY